MGFCKNCDFVGDTHFHHIVPRSRGGSDNPSNLIEVCHDCHRKIHGADFGGETGLIKQGVKNKKSKGYNANKWMDDNIELIGDFIYDFSIENDTYIISDMMNFGMMHSLDFMECIKTGKHKNIKGDLPEMIFSFARSDDKYKMLI
ncbi:MAG: HNH endonuclease [Acinetobacter sp.]